ncbi:MAG TPA: hypothetical protein VK656_06405, partial [Candidatus Acidoferrum sp.]|nr:hypothetical protein [Candidatus Acidoferrum sp.]
MAGDDVWDYPAMREHGTRRHRPPTWRFGIGVAALSIALSACGNATTTPAQTASLPSGSLDIPSNSAGPSPTPEDPAAVYARIEQQVVAIRGLDLKSPVTPRLLDDAGLAKELASRFDANYPPAEVAAEQALDVGLGLLPADMSLRDELSKLLTSQVAGFYEPDTKK